MGDWTYKITEKYDALYSSFILKTANLSYSHWLSWSFACEAKTVYREVGKKKNNLASSLPVEVYLLNFIHR